MSKWIGFWLLGLIWGSSFLLIRVGVAQFSPFQLVFIRTGIAAVGINLILILTRTPYPRDWKTLRSLIIIGIGNTVIPFILITWGEISVESGLASVLQATAALFSFVVAHFVFEDERINPRKIGGLLTGFVGVVVLASRNWVDGQVIVGGLLGQLAIVVASLFYALFTSYSRTVIRGQVEPLMVAGMSMLTASLVTIPLMILAPLFGGVPFGPIAGVGNDALFAVLMLGLLNTFIAYLIFYPVVRALGAGRAAMVTYIVPAVGLTLGALVGNEQIDARLILGAALIMGGIGIVNLRLFRRPTPAAPAPVVPQQQTQ